MNSKIGLTNEIIESFLEKEYNIKNLKTVIHKKTLSTSTSKYRELSDIPNSNLFIFRPEYFIIYENENKLENVIVNFSKSSIGLKPLSYAQLQSQIANSSKSVYISTKGLSHDLYNILFSNPGIENDLLSYNDKKIELYRFNLDDLSFYKEEI